MSLAERRRTPADPGGHALTLRRKLGLRFVHEAGPVTTSQYAAFLDIAKSLAWRDLRVLRDHECVRVFSPSPASENVYTVAPGARPVLAATGLDPGDIRCPRALSAVSDHHGWAVDAHVALAVACVKTRRLRLARYAYEAELRARVGDARGALVPDAVAIVEYAEGGERALAIEVDLASESTPYVLAHKLRPYADLCVAGSPLLGVAGWRVLFLVPSVARLNRLATAAWDANLPEGLFYFATRAWLAAATVFGTAGWRTPRPGNDGGGELVPESPLAGMHERARADCSRSASTLSRDLSSDSDNVVEQAPGSFAQRKDA